jgi:putative hydrolases of HD superfamily
MIDFLLASYALKDERRAGWVLRGVSDPESVADHSWGTALLCLLYAPAGGGPDAVGDNRVERNRAAAMALVHDIAEAEMGDVATRVHPEERTMTPEEKRLRETEAFGILTSLLPQYSPGRAELTEMWQEYETAATATARFVRDMNLCDMCLQALLYQRDRRYSDREGGGGADGNPAFRHFERLDEFFETSRPRISTETGRRLFEEIERRYRQEATRPTSV